MSVGLMNKRAKLIRATSIIDSEGFTSHVVETIAEIRVYVEGRHGSEQWANLAAFSEATDLFRFRKIPKIKVTTELFLEYNDETYNILSVENVKGKDMYIEVLAKRVESTIG